MKQLAQLAILVAAGGLGACADPPALFGDKPVISGPTTQGPPPDLWMKPAYPEGPYGNKQDDTLKDFTAPGYRLTPDQQDSSQVAWDDNIKLSDYWQTKCKCLLISWGASWCGACQQEQPALIADVAADPDFCVLNILQEGPVNGSNMVTSDDVTEWTQKFKQNYYVVKGDAYTHGLWQGWDMNGSIGLPFNLVVRTSDMHIVAPAVQGFDPMIHDNARTACGL